MLTRGDRFIVRAYSPSVTSAAASCSIRIRRARPIRQCAPALARYRRLDAPAMTARQRGRWRSWTSARGAGTRAARSSAVPGCRRPRRTRPLSRLAAAGRATRVGDLLRVAGSLAGPVQSPAGRVDRAPRGAAAVGRDVARRGARAAVRTCGAGGLRARAGGAGGRRDRSSPAIGSRSPGHHVSLSPEEARAQEAIERLFREAGLAPPAESALPRRPTSARRLPTGSRSCSFVRRRSSRWTRCCFTPTRWRG